MGEALVSFGKYTLVAASSLLAACGHYARPPYETPMSVPRAKITVDQTAGEKWVCIDKMQRTIRSEKGGYGVIPAGRRITVGSAFTSGDERRIFGCNPRLSFIPAEGETYHLEFAIEGKTCFLSVFREESGRRTGVALEPSMAQGDPACEINTAPTQVRSMY